MENQISGGLIAAILLLELAAYVLYTAGLWKLFVKAGRPGWASIVPLYNLVVMQDIVGREPWKIVLMVIPFVNIYFLITLHGSFAKAYGKYGAGNYLAAVFFSLIVFPLWGFSNDVRYEGEVEGRTTDMMSAA